MKIKICGLMREQDTELCGKLGVHIAGFVTEYPVSVPWNIDRERARALLACVKRPMESCIVTGGSREKIIALAEYLNPDYVQLHFHETVEDAQAVAETLLPRGIKVIKTLPADREERERQFGTGDLWACMELLNRTAVAAVLWDTRSPDNARAGGGDVDLQTFVRLRNMSRKPMVLAGGITAETVEDAAGYACPEIVDIMTGVEVSPGIKDPEKLKRVTASRYFKGRG